MPSSSSSFRTCDNPTHLHKWKPIRNENGQRCIKIYACEKRCRRCFKEMKTKKCPARSLREHARFHYQKRGIVVLPGAKGNQRILPASEYVSFANWDEGNTGNANRPEGDSNTASEEGNSNTTSDATGEECGAAVVVKEECGASDAEECGAVGHIWYDLGIFGVS